MKTSSRENPEEGYSLAEPPGSTPARPIAEPGIDRTYLSTLLLWAALILHVIIVFDCMGGWADLVSTWPLPWHDHPMHFHNAWVVDSFLRQSGTTAGYDPYFMAGYANSVVSDPSGTMIETVLAVIGQDRAAIGYKWLVFYCVASLPFWVLWATRIWGGGARAGSIATLLFLAYLWTDFPLAYAGLGMIAFLLVIPVSVALAGQVVRYLDRGGLGTWTLTVVAAALTLWIHPLSLMAVGPAAGLAYLGAATDRRDGQAMPFTRHAGLWLLLPMALAANAWWWLPALTLSSTGSPQDIAFVHDESVWERLAQIFGLIEPEQPPAESVLLAMALVGGVGSRVLSRSGRVGLASLVAAGFFFGYLSGWFRSLDPLQPGRHTYTLYTASAVLAGLGWERLIGLLGHRGRVPWSLILGVGLLMVGVRIFNNDVLMTVTNYTARNYLIDPPELRNGTGRPRWLQPLTTPSFSARPDTRMLELVNGVKTHFQSGERIYYEEGGRERPGIKDPFEGRRFGGLLPGLTGVEVIGGPFLNLPLKTNFTQVGMGLLFGEADWSLERFDRYARLYRPGGIICWSDAAKSFCRDHPDRMEILEDGPFYLFARVRGFEGDAIRGEATVEAEAGRLTVRMHRADVDGKVVLSYHSVPGMRSVDGLAPESETLEDDPVPFIRLPFSTEPVTLELKSLPW